MSITIKSTKLGEISMEEDQIIAMPEGIPGFRHVGSYALVGNDKGHPFLWFQAMDDPDLAFVVTDPAVFWPDYRPAMPSEDLIELELLDSSLMAVLVIVTIPGEDITTWTANLMAPLLINTRTRKGKQVVLYDSDYTHREPLAVATIGA